MFQTSKIRAIQQSIPMHLQDTFKSYVVISENTAEAYDVAFNALCAVRVMIEKQSEPAEIDQYIADIQSKLVEIGLRNKTSRIKKEPKNDKKKLVK